MSWFYTFQRRAPQRLFLAPLVGLFAVSACKDDLPQSPSEPAPFQVDALQADTNASGKSLIAFLNARPNENFEIYVMKANGKKQRRLTNDTNVDLAPAWSPDRTKIAFASRPNGNPDADIYVMNADGTGRTRLTNDPRFENNPTWSPDGSKIAFDRDGELIIMNADGTNQTVIPHAADDLDSDPDWSPDGSKIAFSRDRQFAQCEDIWVMNVDGSQQVQLTPDRQSCFDLGAAWSPDGSKIAFISNRTGRYQVYVMRSDGSGQTAFNNDLGQSIAPTWSPDGNQIAFVANPVGGSDNIYVMNADGSGRTQVTVAGGESPAWAP